MNWKNIIDQTLHVIIFGAIAFWSTELAIVAICVRELTSVPLPWVLKGQWPPNSDQYVDVDEYLPEARVEDLRWDLVFSFGGAVAGGLMRIGWMLWG